ncbi:MAG TPA: CHAT domain-containing protein, partial [Candidatus Eisenbacteria bacterium]|nr:CHAT domain-containing protein [Candidatus Eisenbacteria bacterium]
GFGHKENKTVDDLLNILDSGYFDLLHISAHGSYDPDEPLLSHISIEEGREDFRGAESIVGPKVRAAFDRNNPIVFLNACQSGRQGYSLTGVDGWAEQFIKAGASAFIGTLWSVTHTKARKFTENRLPPSQEQQMKVLISSAIRQGEI